MQRKLRVTASRRLSAFPNSGTVRKTGSSNLSSPRSQRSIATVVVAMTLVSEARSKAVSVVTFGDSEEYSNLPRLIDSTTRRLPATDKLAPGKARSLMARSRISIDVAKPWLMPAILIGGGSQASLVVKFDVSTFQKQYMECSILRKYAVCVSNKLCNHIAINELTLAFYLQILEA